MTVVINTIMKIIKLFKKGISFFLKESSGNVGSASRSGFLLIELLISMTIFSIVVAVAVGSFINVLNVQRQVAALSAAQSNLGVVIEQMAREIRTGSLFCTDASGDQNPSNICGFCVLSGSEEICPALDFNNAGGDNVKYFLDASGTLEKSVNNATPEEITGNDVTIQHLNFILLGNTPGSQWNPRITVAIGIHPNNLSVLNLETTVSARQD